MRWSRNRGEVIERLHCSFCNKHQDDVKKLIAGPMVFICNECVAVCNEILGNDAFEDEAAEAAAANAENPGLTIACSLCSCHISWAQTLPVTDRGVLCPECVAEVVAAIERIDADEHPA
jgi:hypothetical protein